MKAVLTEATAALARLDFAALEELEARARELVLRGERVVAVPEVEARFRVFAEVVRATGENLRVCRALVQKKSTEVTEVSRRYTEGGGGLWGR